MFGIGQGDATLSSNAGAQTVFSGLVKLLVRELRTTERTNVIVLYLGSVSTLGAAVACTILPGGFVLPTKTLQLYYLLGAGPLTTNCEASTFSLRACNDASPTLIIISP